MFYDLLICAVNPSVCLRWEGAGWEGEGMKRGRVILSDVLVAGGGRGGRGKRDSGRKFELRGT